MSIATQTLTRLYDNHTDAVATVRALEDAGLDHAHISLLAADGGRPGTAADGAVNDVTHVVPPARDEHTAIGTGAGVGTVLGGGLGLLAALGTIVIPGVGPMLGVGWLLATLTGAGVGAAVGGLGAGLAGALTHAGVPDEHIDVYSEALHRGASLLTVRVPESRIEEIERILDHTAPLDPTLRRGIYEEDGWTYIRHSSPGT